MGLPLKRKFGKICFDSPGLCDQVDTYRSYSIKICFFPTIPSESCVGLEFYSELESYI